MLTLESLTASNLAGLGVNDSERGLRILRSLPGNGVTDDTVDELLPLLLNALSLSPDPDRALTTFSRWIEAVTNRFTHVQYLLRHPAAIDIFFNICGVSQLFADILVRNPEYLEILANPGVRGNREDPAKSSSAVYRELSGFVDGVQRTELKLEAMRRFKQREILRIGTRDILNLADMPTTAREFSNLADACVQKCLEIGMADLREKHGGDAPAFLVVGMGKLGGQELNYSSDIDLIFVCGDEDSREAGEEPPSAELGIRDTSRPIRTDRLSLAHSLAEFVINALSRNTQNGHLFRVDVRLRPEGRFGALVRTLSSFRAYYESWAEPWERQSLIKARAVAGDPRLGADYIAMVQQYVYRRGITSDFIDAIRQNKARIEQKAEIEGVSHTNVKVGIGGIRDIEFIAQLYQMLVGSRDSRLRTTNTLDALARLRQIGEITASEYRDLSEDYQYLRTIEHRLQILYERQTQSLPDDPEERRLLARRLGYNDSAQFDEDYERRTERVRNHFSRLFHGGQVESPSRDIWRDLLETEATAGTRSAILYGLQAEGFHDPERALASIRAAASGTEYGQAAPDSREQFLRIASRLVTVCGQSGNPDSALSGIESLALATPNPAQLYRLLSEGDGVLDRLCRLGAASLPMMQSLSRNLAWLDMLLSEEIGDSSPKNREAFTLELRQRLDGVESEDAFYDGLAAYFQRERLRTASRDVWGEIGTPTVGLEVTALAEAVLECILIFTREQTISRGQYHDSRAVLNSIAIIGLGKLGGRELGYGSDSDILLVYEQGVRGLTTRDAAALHAVAEAILAAAGKLKPRGADVEIDARLRPEGSVGALAFTPAEYRDYYRYSALTWERQVLTRARPVAGDSSVGRSYMRAAHEAVFGAPLSSEAIDEIRAMKVRIEKERLNPDELWTDVKLGHGGLADIEFTAQMLQMRHGRMNPSVRVPGTVDGLHSLAAIGAISRLDAARLADVHVQLAEIRNRIALQGAPKSSRLPSDAARLRAIAIALGATDSPLERAESRFLRDTEERLRESRQIVERLFYGR